MTHQKAMPTLKQIQDFIALNALVISLIYVVIHGIKNVIALIRNEVSEELENGDWGLVISTLVIFAYFCKYPFVTVQAQLKGYVTRYPKIVFSKAFLASIAVTSVNDFSKFAYNQMVNKIYFDELNGETHQVTNKIQKRLISMLDEMESTPEHIQQWMGETLASIINFGNKTGDMIYELSQSKQFTQDGLEQSLQKVQEKLKTAIGILKRGEKEVQAVNI